LGVPGMLQVSLEWWAFELLSLFCGLLPNAVSAIGANAILLNIASLNFMFYLGVSVSGNVRIGNALGAGDPTKARVVTKLTFGLALFFALNCAVVLLLFRQTIPRLYTLDGEIDRLAGMLLFIVAAFQFSDSINAATQGIFRGSGRQFLGAKLSFAAYYLLGIPLGCCFAFVFHWGIYGLWLGVTTGSLLNSIVGVLLIAHSDWTLLSAQARNRVKQ